MNTHVSSGYNIGNEGFEIVDVGYFICTHMCTLINTQVHPYTCTTLEHSIKTHAIDSNDVHVTKL